MRNLLLAAFVALTVLTSCEDEEVLYVKDVCSRIEDPVLARYCLDNYDWNGDGAVSVEEAQVVKAMYIDGMGISSLRGIEYFRNLETLVCDMNKFTSVDLSKNTRLDFLGIGGNNLRSLDLSNCYRLTDLHCDNNRLTSLDLSANARLKILVLSDNNLSSLDLSKCTAMTDLICSENELTSLDVSMCPDLKLIRCSSNMLASLDLSACAESISLGCDTGTAVYVRNGQQVDGPSDAIYIVK